MAQLPGAFNPNDHEEMADFSAMPPGKYIAKITKSEKKASKKNKKNFYWKLEFTIQEGNFKGRKVWVNLNLVNSNPEAVDIAQRELTSICKAVGSGPISATEELHGMDIEIDVSIVPSTPRFPESNTVKGYHPVAGAARPTKPTSDDADDADDDDNGNRPWDEEFDDDIPF